MNLVAHLHGLEDAHHVVGLNLLANLYKDVLDNAGKRRLDHVTASSGSSLAGSGFGSSHRCVAHGNTFHSGSSLGLFGQFNIIGHTVQLDVCNVAFNVIDGNIILVTIDLIFVFLHLSE